MMQIDKKRQRWNEKRVIVTGGASFIGSHLVDKLAELGAKVTVVDNLSSGRFENLEKCQDKINLIKKDLEYLINLILQKRIVISSFHQIIDSLNR